MPSHPLFERVLLSRAISTHTRPGSTPPKPSTQQDLTRHFLALLLSLSQPPNPTHPKTLSALDSLLLTHTRTRPLDPTPSLLLLRGLSLLKKLTRSRSLLLHLRRRTRIPPLFLFSAALQCTLRHGTIRDVETLFADLDPNVTVSDFVVCLCRRSGNPSEVGRVYSRISSNSWRLSREAYVGLIGVSCGLGRVVLNEMEEGGIEADGLSYFAAFRGFCRDGNVFEADSVLRDWSRRRRGVGDLGACVYGEFLYGLCKSGKFREARKLFGKMTTGDSDRQTALNPSDLLRARRRVIFQLVYPGVIREEVAFKAYFRSLCSFGKVEEAEKLLSVTKNKDTCVYNSYVKALFRAGRIDDALRFFGSKRNEELASSIIFGLCENGRVDDGHRLLEETITTEGFVPTARVLNCIIKGYWKNGREEKAREIFKRMSSESCNGYRTKPDSETYSVMIGKFLEKGEVDIGISLLDEMRAKKLNAGVDLYCDIVRGLYKCGRVDEGEKWMNVMIENGILVSYESWESLYDSVIMEGDREIGELWKEVEANCKARENEKRRLKRK